MPHRSLKLAVAAWGTAIIDGENGESLVNQDLMKQIARPLIADGLSGRTAIDVNDERKLSGRFDALRRHQQFAINPSTVFGLEVNEFGSNDVKVIDASCVPDVLAGATDGADRHSGRRQDGGKLVNIVLAIIGKCRFMRAIFLRNSLQGRAIELHGVKLALPRIIFVTGEIDDAGGFIDSLDTGQRTRIA